MCAKFESLMLWFSLCELKFGNLMIGLSHVCIKASKNVSFVFLMKFLVCSDVGMLRSVYC